MIEVQILEEAFFQTSFKKETEVEKAIGIRNQLNDSIEWMRYIAPNEKDAVKKSALLMDIEAATRERDRLNKELTKVGL